MARKKFCFNGENSIDYGIYTTGTGTFNGTSKIQNKTTVPGRNGDLIVTDGVYNNITYPIKIGFYGITESNFEQKAMAIRSWLLSPTGYCRLEDDYHPDVYRMAQLPNGIDFDVSTILVVGEAELNFDCKPQQYLKTGETPIPIHLTGTLVNPTRFDAKPLIYVTGTGAIKIGDTQITVTENAGDLVIDCDVETAYGANMEDRNSDITLDTYDRFFTLKPGVNGVEIPDSMELVVVPRWWTL